MQDSAIEFTVRAYCKTSDFVAFRCDLYEQCLDALRKEGIQIPFPQIDVHLDSHTNH